MAAIADLKHLAPIVIDDGVSPVSIGAIQSVTIRTETEILKEVSGGQIYPSRPRIAAANVGATFTTWSLVDAIDNFNVFRYCIPSGTNVRFYLATRDCGGNKAGSTHTRFSFANGIIVPRTLRCDHRGHAQISYELIGISTNGITAPVSHDDDDQAMVTDFGDNDSRFSLAAAAIGANLVTNKQSVEIDFGVEVSRGSGDSDVYDTFAGIRSASPRTTFGLLDPSQFATFDLSGVVGTHANSYIYLRKRNVADGTAEHIGITTAGLAHTETIAEGSVTDNFLTNRIILDSYYDGTNAPFVVDTTFALS
jgi:hypothetical protein